MVLIEGLLQLWVTNPRSVHVPDLQNARQANLKSEILFSCQGSGDKDGGIFDLLIPDTIFPFTMACVVGYVLQVDMGAKACCCNAIPS